MNIDLAFLTSIFAKHFNGPVSQTVGSDAIHPEKLRVDAKMGPKLKVHKKPFGKFSLSHCHSYVLYGQVLGTTHAHIGVDIELTDRVEPEVARRILAKPKPRGAFGKLQSESPGPFPAALWCAKEAAWKACSGDRQPPTISGLELCQWKQIATHGDPASAIWEFHLDDFENFGFQNELGLVTQVGDHTVAIFVGAFI